MVAEVRQGTSRRKVAQMFSVSKSNVDRSSLILYDVFNVENVPIDYSMILFYPVETKRITVIADPHFILDQNRGKEIQKAYNNTLSVKYFESRANDFDTRIYPYTNLRVNQEGLSIDIREGEWDKP